MSLSKLSLTSTLACLAFLGGSASAQISPEQTVRISFKRVLSSDGFTPSPWTPATIDAMFTEARDIFSTAGIKLVQETPASDLLDPGYPNSFFDVDFGVLNTALNTFSKRPSMEAAAETSPALYKFSPTAVNIYLSNTLVGFLGFCSFPSPIGNSNTDDLIFMRPVAPGRTTSGGVLAHEIGHYLGLFHTHEIAYGVEIAGACGPGPNCMTAGDFVCDTLADPWMLPPLTAPGDRTAFDAVYPPGGCSQTSTVLSNAMSFYGPGPWLFTPGQAARMETFLNSTRYRVRESLTPLVPTLTSASLVGTSLDLLGSDMMPPPLAGIVSVGLGETFCVNIGTPSPACFAELVSNPVNAFYPSKMTATFPSAVPPGNHTVNLYHSGNLVATLPNALQVGPSIEHSVVNPATTDLRDRIRSSTGGAENFLIAIGPEVPPTPFGGGSLRVDLTAPTIQYLNVAVPAVGFTDVFYPLSGIPAFTTWAVQGVELGTGLVTNMVRISRL